MRLGVAGLLADGSVEAARRLRGLGLRAASWHLPDLNRAADAHALRRTREVLEGEGLLLAQLLPPDYPSLVHPDPQQRADGVAALARVLDAAVKLGAGSVYVRPGSLNPSGPWTPHPLNRAPETRERLIESLRALTPRAEAARIPLAVEAHVLSPLPTVEAVAEVFRQVGSPWLRFNADPVNLIGSLEEAYDTAAVIHRLFGQLGNVVIAAHAKDVRVGERLVLQIEECVPGQGLLDQAAFLCRFHACCPDGTVLIEHLPAEQVPAARRALQEVAERVGLRFEE
jgi:sugar phosphate isomerase/epimerase